MRPIALIGLAGSGKDTVTEIIRESTRFKQRVAFGDAVKKLAATVLGIDTETLEVLKRTDTSVVIMPTSFMDRLRYLFCPSKYHKISIRQLLHNTGTTTREVEALPDSIWRDIAKTKISINSSLFLTSIVTDVRFEEEYKMLKEMDAIFIRVNRNVDKLDLSSETGLPNVDVDYTINNNGTKSALRYEVHKILKEIYDIQE